MLKNKSAVHMVRVITILLGILLISELYARPILGRDPLDVGDLATGNAKTASDGFNEDSGKVPTESNQFVCDNRLSMNTVIKYARVVAEDAVKTRKATRIEGKQEIDRESAFQRFNFGYENSGIYSATKIIRYYKKCLRRKEKSEVEGGPTVACTNEYKLGEDFVAVQTLHRRPKWQPGRETVFVHVSFSVFQVAVSFDPNSDNYYLENVNSGIKQNLVVPVEVDELPSNVRQQSKIVGHRVQRYPQSNCYLSVKKYSYRHFKNEYKYRNEDDAFWSDRDHVWPWDK